MVLLDNLGKMTCNFDHPSFPTAARVLEEGEGGRKEVWS